MFTAPANSDVYTEEIVNRCFDFIEYGIWKGVDPTRLKQWLKNFDGAEERYFAACLLDSTIFRSAAQTDALLYQWISKTIPNFLRENPPPDGKVIDNLQAALRSNIDPGLRLVCAAGEFDPPSKSGFYISRLLKRRLRISESWLIRPERIKACIENQKIANFIFIDDFVGTGSQFDDTYSHLLYIQNKMIDPQYLFAYAPLVAHERGVEHIQTHNPGIKVTAVEYLDNSHSAFNSAFNDQTNTPDDARDFYSDFLRKRGIVLSEEEKFGYGNLELCYFFEHASADNNLHVFWWDRDSRLNPLFGR